MTALHCAAAKGHLDIVRLLLERGAYAEAVNNVSNRTSMPVCLPANIILVCVFVFVYVLYVRTCVYLHLIS